MTWVGEPMTWILIGVAGCVLLGLICILWATQGRPMSESPHHDEFGPGNHGLLFPRRHLQPQKAGEKEEC